MTRTISDTCPKCSLGFGGPSDMVAKAIARHIANQHPPELDPEMLEAMAEVDAMNLSGPPLLKGSKS